MLQVPLEEDEKLEKTPRPSGIVGRRGDKDTADSLFPVNKVCWKCCWNNLANTFVLRLWKLSLVRDQLVLYCTAKADPFAF